MALVTQGVVDYARDGTLDNGKELITRAIFGGIGKKVEKMVDGLNLGKTASYGDNQARKAAGDQVNGVLNSTAGVVSDIVENEVNKRN